MSKPKQKPAPKSKYFADTPAADENAAMDLLSNLPETPEPATVRPAPQPLLTKTEAVRRAVAAGKSMPTEGAAWIKEQFGIEVAPNLFSTLKAQAIKGKAAPKAKETPAAAPVGGVDLARKVKALVAEYGAEQVAQMASVFGE